MFKFCKEIFGYIVTDLKIGLENVATSYRGVVLTRSTTYKERTLFKCLELSKALLVISANNVL